jgi:ribosome biogenesis GTPase A
MKSILEANPLDDFIAMAEMEDRDFEVAKVIDEEEFLSQAFDANKAASEQFSTIQDSNENKKKRIQEFTTESFQQLQLVIPRKPKWNYNMTVEEIQRNESNSFLQWRRSIASLEQKYSYLLKLTPYEKNLEVWRQLWRVCERSNIIIQVIDARNPLLYYTKDLQEYVAKEFQPSKSMILLVNKSDLLTDYQRVFWYEYFRKMKIKVFFYSAYLSQKELDAMNDEEIAVELQSSNTFDFHAIFSKFADFFGSFSLPTVRDQYQNQKNFYKKVTNLDREEYEEEFVWGNDAEYTTTFRKTKPSAAAGNQKPKLAKEGSKDQATTPSSAAPEEVTSAEKSPAKQKAPTARPAAGKSSNKFSFEDDDEDEDSDEEEGEEGDLEEVDEDDEDGMIYDENDMEEVLSEEGDGHSEDDDEDEEEGDEEEEVPESEPQENFPSEEIPRSHAFNRNALTVPESCKILTRRELLGIMTFLAKIMKDELEVVDGRVVHKTTANLAASTSSKSVPPDSFRGSFGLVGFPNVGKSSVINTLLGVSRSNHGKVRVGVSSTPGKTKHFQTLILSSDIMLCDCPGLVFPSIMTSAGEMLCSGILPVNHMRDHVEPANLIAARVPSHLLEACYGMKIIRNLDLLDSPDRPPTGEEVMAAYCKIKGYITGHTGRWDEFRACKEILRDFNDGKILYVAMPPRVTESGELDRAHPKYDHAEKEFWIHETEKTVVRNQKIAERMAQQKVTVLPTMMETPVLGLDLADGMEGQEEGEDIVYEFIEEETPLEELDEEGAEGAEKGGETTMVHPNRIQGRDHKRLKTWGKKGRKLRDKTPYGETNDIRSYTVHVKNRSSTGVDIVKN